jgi:hypothetical protein
VCGRADGRLSAPTSLEATVCLSVNQASSIQNLGGSCESITIGHGPFKLPLSERAIFLRKNRPKFFCNEKKDYVTPSNSTQRKDSRKRNRRSSHGLCSYLAFTLVKLHIVHDFYSRYFS